MRHMVGIRDSNLDLQRRILQDTKKTCKFARFHLCYSTWLGLVNLFQTFEDLESVKDNQADTQAVRQLVDEDETTRGKNDEDRLFPKN